MNTGFLYRLEEGVGRLRVRLGLLAWSLAVDHLRDRQTADKVELVSEPVLDPVQEIINDGDVSTCCSQIVGKVCANKLRSTSHQYMGFQ